MRITVKYELSQVGQKADIVAGGTGVKGRTLESDLPGAIDLMPFLTASDDGSLSLVIDDVQVDRVMNFEEAVEFFLKKHEPERRERAQQEKLESFIVASRAIFRRRRPMHQPMLNDAFDQLLAGASVEEVAPAPTDTYAMVEAQRDKSVSRGHAGPKPAIPRRKASAPPAQADVPPETKEQLQRPLENKKQPGWWPLGFKKYRLV